MLRTLLYGSSLTALAATVHQVMVPMRAHAEPACCNYEEPDNSCGGGAICKYTNDECQTSDSANANGWTCVDD
ncbi:hypothetical protein [Silvibacterium sp.]|uniref:hypothetical protein n=1 Tax=Silvibacterium sp. TaxID=1964179 RepID=UPI0039E67DE0